MLDFMMQLLFTFDGMLRSATPLIFCAMAGIFSERSGIVDISLEGKMLFAAFIAAIGAHFTGSALYGLGLAMLSGVALSLVHGFATITHRGDQVVSGLAINMLAAGVTVVVGHALFRRGGQTPDLSGAERFNTITLPAVELIGKIPLIGPIYEQVISGHNILVYMAWIAVAVTSFVLYKTSFGLRLRSVGEYPKAADTAGVSVAWVRYRALIIGGLLSGFAGAYLAIAAGASFGRDMSAGKGYIALAAVIFGNWKPRAALFACLLFGFLEAVSARIEGVKLFGVAEIPTQLTQAIPYVLTVLLLAGFIGRPRPPAAIGQPGI